MSYKKEDLLKNWDAYAQQTKEVEKSYEKAVKAITKEIDKQILEDLYQEAANAKAEQIKKRKERFVILAGTPIFPYHARGLGRQSEISERDFYFTQDDIITGDPDKIDVLTISLNTPDYPFMYVEKKHIYKLSLKPFEGESQEDQMARIGAFIKGK